MEHADGLLDCRLTRNPVADDQDDGGIPLAEWEALIANDPTLEPVAFLWGRNPQTGEPIKIPAKTVLKFRIAKAMKELALK